MLLLLLAAMLVSALSYGSNTYVKVPEVNQHCLDCICQASSNCDETTRCNNVGGYFCGPFVISWAYWYDSGRPGHRGKIHDFETCLTNRRCAEEAVRGYMRRYGRDCDASGRVDCYDFARIHKLGFDQCSKDSSILYTEYWRKFQTCYGYDPPVNNRMAPEYDYYYYD